MSSSGAFESNEGATSGGRSCPSFDDLSAWFDGFVDKARSSELRSHIEQCAMCASVLHDLELLRSALIATSPSPISIDLVFTSKDLGLRPQPDVTRRAPAPLFPVVTAIAALLVIALLAGQLFSGSDDTTVVTPESANQVLIIDGTPFSAEDNDAEFSAASAGDMNDRVNSNDQVSIEETNASPAWWAVFGFSAVVMLAGTFLWFRDRERTRSRHDS